MKSNEMQVVLAFIKRDMRERVLQKVDQWFGPAPASKEPPAQSPTAYANYCMAEHQKAFTAMGRTGDATSAMASNQSVVDEMLSAMQWLHDRQDEYRQRIQKAEYECRVAVKQKDDAAELIRKAENEAAKLKRELEDIKRVAKAKRNAQRVKSREKALRSKA